MKKLEFRNKLIAELDRLGGDSFVLVISPDLEKFIPNLILIMGKEVELSVVVDDEFPEETFKLE